MFGRVLRPVDTDRCIHSTHSCSFRSSDRARIWAECPRTRRQPTRHVQTMHIRAWYTDTHYSLRVGAVGRSPTAPPQHRRVIANQRPPWCTINRHTSIHYPHTLTAYIGRIRRGACTHTHTHTHLCNRDGAACNRPTIYFVTIN